MDSFAISIDCCPDMVQRLFTIVKENPVSELTINTVKMSKVEQALKAANETRALRIGSGILNEVAGLFKEQFAGRKAVVVADVTTYRVAGERVEKELRNANIELLPSWFFVKFGGNLFFISTVFFFLNPIKSCRYVCFLVTLKTPHH